MFARCAARVSILLSDLAVLLSGWLVQVYNPRGRVGMHLPFDDPTQFSLFVSVPNLQVAQPASACAASALH